MRTLVFPTLCDIKPLYLFFLNYSEKIFINFVTSGTDFKKRSSFFNINIFSSLNSISQSLIRYFLFIHMTNSFKPTSTINLICIILHIIYDHCKNHLCLITCLGRLGPAMHCWIITQNWLWLHGHQSSPMRGKRLLLETNQSRVQPWRRHSLVLLPCRL